MDRYVFKETKVTRDMIKVVWSRLGKKASNRIILFLNPWMDKTFIEQSYKIKRAYTLYSSNLHKDPL